MMKIKAILWLMTLPGWSSKFNTITSAPLTENNYALSNAGNYHGGGYLFAADTEIIEWLINER